MRVERLSGWPWLEAGVIPLASAMMRVVWIAPVIRFALDNDAVTPPGVRFPTWMVLALLFGANLSVRWLGRSARGARLATLLGLGAVLGSVAYAFRLDAARLGPWLADLIATQTTLAEGVPAAVIVVIELWIIAWVRARYMDTPFVRSALEVVAGGMIVFGVGIAIGSV